MLQAHIKDDFDNLLEYQNWVRERLQNISPLNKSQLSRFERSNVESHIRRSPDWYGEGANYPEMERGITEYKDPDLIEKIFSQVNDHITTAMKDKIKARKVRYNPNGLGVFVFDRAAMGMYRLKEFYSTSLKRVVEGEEVKQNKKGFELLKDGSPVQQRWEQKKDGKPKIRTTSKNVYAYYPKINKEKQAVELFISCGAHVGIKAEAFLYSGISAIIIAQLLEKARIQTRISIVVGSSPDGFEDTAYACIIPVKNYDENLDMNLLALLSSDPRFFRHEGFKGVVSMYDHFKIACPQTLGTGMNKEYLIQTIERSSFSKTAKLAPNRFYFGWTFNEGEAVNAVNETIEEIAEKLV